MRIALIPGCLALLPDYASLEDPVAELRAAVQAAVSWLGEDVVVVAGEQGRRVAASALAARDGVVQDVGGQDVRGQGVGGDVLVVLNGSACRTERAPGYLDERAEPFDAALGAALKEPSAAALRATDTVLGGELWADLVALPQLADLLDGARTVAVDYDAAPFGVQYWVLRWEA